MGSPKIEQGRIVSQTTFDLVAYAAPQEKPVSGASPSTNAPKVAATKLVNDVMRKKPRQDILYRIGTSVVLRVCHPFRGRRCSGRVFTRSWDDRSDETRCTIRVPAVPEIQRTARKL